MLTNTLQQWQNFQAQTEDASLQEWQTFVSWHHCSVSVILVSWYECRDLFTYLLTDVCVYAGEPVLRAEDHVGGLRRDAGQEQPACSHPQHALHCLADQLPSPSQWRTQGVVGHCPPPSWQKSIHFHSYHCVLPLPRGYFCRCLSVCLFVSNFTQKLPNGFAWNFQRRLAMCRWTND